ncbi:MAG: LuxR C-terminal-related transcriptional regulator, partial [Atribacterota bacterium]|nr:LuxR C-terminal-related transcriptional regulator [Atribacterota bacterium]
QRRVQVYCAEGRISGARRVGHMWMIPSGVSKPVDPRLASAEKKSHYWPNFFLLDSTIMQMDSVQQMIDSTTDNLQRKQLIGEIAYMQGDYQKAAGCIDGVRDDSPGYLHALAISTAAKIGVGDLKAFQATWNKLKELRHRHSDTPGICRMVELVQGLLALSAYVPENCPDWILKGVLNDLPYSSCPMALYLRAKGMLALGQIKQLVSTAEATLSFSSSSGSGIQDVYLYIILAHGYVYLQNMDKAYDTLLHAVNICLPKGFISPVAESISSLLGIGERCLKKAYPRFQTPVLSLHRQISPPWLKIHNILTHKNITSLLTRREYQVALSVVGGFNNHECAKRLGISVSTVKGHLQSVYQKLNISSRKALKQFIISA